MKSPAGVSYLKNFVQSASNFIDRLDVCRL
jgi:hypothetical protein